MSDPEEAPVSVTVTAAQIDALQAAAYANLLNGSTEFALKLVTTARRGRLTPAQAVWVPKLLERAQQATTPAPSAALVGDVAEIFTLFTRAAANGLQWPKIHLEAEDGGSVQLSRAGERSRYTGQVMVTDGMPFGANRFFGRIDAAGTLTEGRDMTPAVRRLLSQFAADPAGVAALYGRRSGSCCFCHRHLETTESLAVGYGPTCADNFGLPWGNKAPHAAPGGDLTPAQHAAEVAAFDTTGRHGAALAAAAEAQMHRMEADYEQSAETVGFLSDPDQRALGGERAYRDAREEHVRRYGAL